MEKSSILSILPLSNYPFLSSYHHHPLSGLWSPPLLVVPIWNIGGSPRSYHGLWHLGRNPGPSVRQRLDPSLKAPRLSSPSPTLPAIVGTHLQAPLPSPPPLSSLPGLDSRALAGSPGLAPG